MKISERKRLNGEAEEEYDEEDSLNGGLKGVETHPGLHL